MGVATLLPKTNDLKKHLLVCYNFHPTQGSEEAVGYVFARISAAYRETVVYTQEGYQAAIGAEEKGALLSGIELRFYRPRWFPNALKRIVPSSLYYHFWHLGLFLKLRRERGLQEDFSLCQVNTWVAAAQPVYAVFLPLKTIWGPLGGVARPPLSFFAPHPWRSRVYEWIRKSFLSFAPINLLLRKNYEVADVVVAAANDVRDWIEGNSLKPQESVSVIPAVTFPSQLEVSKNADWVEGEHKLKMVTAARILPWKGVDILLEALALSERGDVEFHIYGDGPDLARLKSLSKKLKLDKLVIFQGKVSRKDFLGELSTADLFLFGSLHDSEGGACMEACGLGVPCVFFDFGGIASCLHGCEEVSALQVENRVDAIQKMSEKIKEAQVKTGIRQSGIPVDSLLFFENKKKEMTRIYQQLENE